ncbi:hypothetical protein HYPSUDRAFT_42692 [Hypholoma sublateritium FD-334 SS-4]|uniref:DUF6534 domain-containing protein n=1 Tax=Hypholoma sublateritium (strain FD-334 SS-4) TaxID=945553 RepID=A0A0D2L2F1_HYPSF|nr:hypothetical protein HYPSUDRAFT_42692 [Hypholoma sublateritium FD-334 SS-4]
MSSDLGTNINPTYGAYLVGTVLSYILLGVTCLQTYMYFRTYRDGLLIQATIVSLLFFELVHGALSMHILYFYLIHSFFNPSETLQSIWSLKVMFGITGSIVLIVHLSYATRIYHVSGRRRFIPICIAIFSFGNFSLGWALMGELFAHPFVQTLSGRLEDLAKAILISSAVIDLIIAATLSCYLHRARTGTKRTDKIIDGLMIYTINNGVLTSLFSTVALILVFTRPNDLYSLAVSQIIGSLYSNSLMATVNSRKSYMESAATSRAVSSYALSEFGAASNPAMRGALSVGSAVGATTANAHRQQDTHSMIHTGSTLGIDDYSV